MTQLIPYLIVAAVALVLAAFLRPRKGFDGLLRDCRGGVDFNLISRDAQRALEEFSEQMTAALMQDGVEPWAKNLGLANVSRALKTTYPIPVSAAGYVEFKGDIKYRALFEKSLTLVPKTWQDGVAELASIVEAPDFIGWAQQPAAMAAAAQSLPNEIIAGLLEDNPTCWTGKNFFASDHPSNVFDANSATFDNDLTYSDSSAPGLIAAIELAKVTYRSIKAPSQPSTDPKPLGMRMTHVLAPAAMEELWRDALERDLIIDAVSDGASGRAFGAVNNRHKGTVQLIVSDELTDDDTFYTLALAKPGVFPWIVQDEGAPEEILHDKNSSLYTTQLKIGLAYILRGNGALALPHAVQRFTLAT